MADPDHGHLSVPHDIEGAVPPDPDRKEAGGGAQSANVAPGSRGERVGRQLLESALKPRSQRGRQPRELSFCPAVDGDSIRIQGYPSPSDFMTSRKSRPLKVLRRCLTTRISAGEISSSGQGSMSWL